MFEAKYIVGPNCSPEIVYLCYGEIAKLETEGN